VLLSESLREGSNPSPTAMKKKIYLDDVRNPIDPEWVVARDYTHFVTIIQLTGLENIEVISLDHDLGDTAMSEYYSNVRPKYTLNYDNIIEKTGYDCCKYLVEKSISTGILLPQIYVHSANPIGAANMMGYINNYYKNCKQEESCIRVQIPHTIEESKMMTEEQRHLKWKK